MPNNKISKTALFNQVTSLRIRLRHIKARIKESKTDEERYKIQSKLILANEEISDLIYKTPAELQRLIKIIS